ncbi:HTH-type transcriptional repressor FabR [Acinetobacter sp. MD2(2019)]|nr:HTH-type transcriptional repressor FabR [Acinetobacter sp. MD2(2019)]
MYMSLLSESPSQRPEPEIQVKVTRGAGRRATITKEELFQATLNLIGPQKSIASLSLREIAREAGIAPNSFYRHFKDIDELAIALINRAGLVLRKIIREARLQANRQDSVIRSSIEIFLQQLNDDEGNLGLLLREGYTGSTSYKKAVEQQLSFFQQELQEDLIRLERLLNHNKKLSHPDLAAQAITQLVFNMGAKVLDLSSHERKHVAEQTITMIRMILQGSRHLDKTQLD